MGLIVKLMKLKSILLFFITSVTLIIIAIAAWGLSLNRTLNQSLQGEWFLPPVEIHSAPLQLLPQMNFSLQKLVVHLKSRKFVQKKNNQKITSQQFSIWNRELCQAHLPEKLSESATQCLAFSYKNKSSQRQKAHFNLVIFALNKILQLYQGEPLQLQTEIELPPHLFAQFYNGKPVLRRLIELGNAPLQCLQAVTAIEDDQFLEHSGISFKGIARAIKNLIQRQRIRGGGSTITQQLIKNYFLTSEQTFRRKFTELFMALLLESKLKKDEILRHYLNVIYMGQNGPFQVRGFGSAAEHYFAKELEHLELHECALLAAILNCPGCYNPFTQKTKALQRRKLVLERMESLNMITETQRTEASQRPLPERPPRLLSEPAPYFIQMVYKELEEKGIAIEPGMSIFTTLNEEAQESAHTSVQQGLSQLEKRFKKIKKRQEQGQFLQSLLVSVDLKTGGINALMGGRSYKNTQYNRVTQSHRQVGSIMKPLVYLTALESTQPNGDAYTPLTLIDDSKWVHKYEGQRWSPRNYDRQFHGKVPMFFALKSSYNSATARLGVDIGLNSVIEVAQRLGVKSNIKPYPSLSLGAFELYPREVLKAYGTIARFGEEIPLHSVLKVIDINRDEIYTYKPKKQQLLSPQVAAVLVGMLKQTVASGTARSIPLYGFEHPTAGKTGTTSDTKDAWFMGFTPHTLALTWVGYDDNTPHGLTGASGAIPIWVNYMKRYAQQYPPDDFIWPEGTTQYHLSVEDLSQKMPQYELDQLNEAELIFRSGNEP